MKSQELSRRKQQLDDLFVKVATASSDLELQAHWARYLGVLVSGFLEASVRLLYADHSRKRSAPEVANYVDSIVGRFQNASKERIIEVTRSFSPAWADQLRDQTFGDLKDAVDSIVANRHAIAHGDYSGITYVRVKDYYERVVRVIELIEKQLV